MTPETLDTRLRDLGFTLSPDDLAALFPAAKALHDTANSLHHDRPA